MFSMGAAVRLGSDRGISNGDGIGLDDDVLDDALLVRVENLSKAVIELWLVLLQFFGKREC